MNHLILYCRSGFEKECAAEITALAGQLNIGGYAKTNTGDAYVLFITHEDEGALSLLQQIDFKRLIFVRQWFAAKPILQNLPTTDRISPIQSAIDGFPMCGDLFVETADTNIAKELSTFCKKFSTPLRIALERSKDVTRALNSDLPRLHLFFIDGTTVYVGYNFPMNSAAWARGIPRLKSPKSAPSRSTLKLEEAWHHFIPAEQWDKRLAPSMTAIDLGAAPGGWTWQLVKRSMFVLAVDNGEMQKELMESGQVKQLKEDGYAFKPVQMVDWMVCDIADKPMRSAELLGRWIANGYCREVIVNWKLPMKKRYDQVKECLQKVETLLAAKNVKAEIRIKQLYHDREEVTVHAVRLS